MLFVILLVHLFTLIPAIAASDVIQLHSRNLI